MQAANITTGGPYYARPSSSFGYWRGGMSDGPYVFNQGSRYGQDNSGVGIFPQGSGPQGAPAWSPTITYLLVFVVAEMVLFKCLERMLR